MTPSNITFIRSDGVEVMRLTRDGIWANPDVAIDDTAKVVLDALDVEIKRLVQKAVEAEREACAKVCDGWLHATGNDCAEAIRARREV